MIIFHFLFYAPGLEMRRVRDERNIRPVSANSEEPDCPAVIILHSV
jgi:hypothetical protein